MTQFTEDVRYWWARRSHLEQELAVLVGFLSVLSFCLIITVIVYASAKKSTDAGVIIDASSAQLMNQVSRQKLIQSTLASLLSDEVPFNGDGGKIASEEYLLKHLRKLTEKVHVAGTQENAEAAAYIHDTWTQQGLDHVEYANYSNVLLSYPDYAKPNTVELVDSAGKVIRAISAGFATVSPGIDEASEEGIKEAVSDEKAKIWWNAYAVPGTATGALVYANFGSAEDFQELDKLGISLKGKIVLIRYGNLFRGSKVYEAEVRGAVGVILYSDPQQAAKDQSLTFPKGVHMPSTGAQRGTLAMINGDPETPSYPSKDYTYRWNTAEKLRTAEERFALPSIPVTPISWDDAKKLLETLDGAALPNESWKGGIVGVDYRLDSKGTNQVKLTVNTHDEHADIRNVIGYIWGSVEPDRYVILSNHFDAWVYGATDPNSGTICLMEVSRIIREAMIRHNWRPRRTLVFAALDGEEFNLIGSTEWIEEHLKQLSTGAVAVINIDSGVTGNKSLSFAAVPLLYRPIANAAQVVPSSRKDLVAESGPTLFDQWSYSLRGSALTGLAEIPAPGGGSDHERFISFAGIAGADVWHKSDSNDLYHSAFQVEWLSRNIIDTDHLRVHRAMTHLWAETVRSLADSLVIPFNVTDYGVMLKTWINEALLARLVKSNLSDKIDRFATVVSPGLKEASDRFLKACQELQLLIDKANSGDESVSLKLVEGLNHRLVALERCFIEERGIPGRIEKRHVIFSPSLFNQYEGSLFSGVFDNFHFAKEFEDKGNTTNKELHRRYANLQMSVIRYSLESAILVLNADPLR